MTRPPFRRDQYGVRYHSETDHRKHGWIFKGCVTVRDAVNAADIFLRENDHSFVLLQVIDGVGSEVELVSWEPSHE